MGDVGSVGGVRGNEVLGGGGAGVTGRAIGKGVAGGGPVVGAGAVGGVPEAV